MELPTVECHKTWLIISLIRHQAIIWGNVDQDLGHRKASLGPDKLIMQDKWSLQFIALQITSCKYKSGDLKDYEAITNIWQA